MEEDAGGVQKENNASHSEGKESQIEYLRAKRTRPANYIEYRHCYICNPPKKFKSELGYARHMKQVHSKLLYKTEKGAGSSTKRHTKRKENDLTF